MDVVALVGNDLDLQPEMELTESTTSNIESYQMMENEEVVCTSMSNYTSSMANDSGISVTCSDDRGYKENDINIEDLETSVTSLSPVIFLFPDGTPLAIVARDSPNRTTDSGAISPQVSKLRDCRTPPPATPKGAKRPPRVGFAEQNTPPPDESDSSAFVPSVAIVDEGFQFYQREIVEFKLAREPVYFPKDVLSKQPEVTVGMRACLLEWLAKITHRCRLKLETFFLAANILDRFLATTALSSDCLQLLGIVSMFIAGKQEENCPLEISQLLQLSEETCSGEKYSRKQALTLERLVLGGLKFDLHPPTSLFFMETLATHRATGCRTEPAMLKGIESRRRFARFVLQVALQDYVLCRFRPSLVAASVLTAVEEALTDDYVLFRPGPYSLMDSEFCCCLQAVRCFVKGLVLQNNGLDEILKYYATK